MESLIFEKTQPGRRGYTLPALDVPSIDPAQVLPRESLRQSPPALPEMSELDVVRHYTRLSQLNFSIDTHFYPLGSCTMKYNPKVCEQVAGFTGFKALHPLQPASTVQGFLQVYYELERSLSEICGMAEFSLQPSAGAHGELAGLLIARAYHKYKGSARKTVIVPDSAHGTNPASAMIAGYQVKSVKSDNQGRVDLQALEAALDRDTAVFMLTNPNTLGLFETQIKDIAKRVHDAGALLYLDGANMNALVGLIRPGDLGFDIMHLNLHKTFSTPHGGGGPAAGPVGVTQALTPFLPVPRVRKTEQGYSLEESAPLSIGKMRTFNGNSLILLRAHTYLRCLGREGVRKVSEAAILNANYLRAKLKDRYQLAIDDLCMHECVVTAAKQKPKGVRTLDIAKRLLDYGFHPPTIYFPLIVDEAMMIEPTETESKQTLDGFIDAMNQIAQEAEQNPDLLRTAPHSTPVRRLDEVTAARQPNLRWKAVPVHSSCSKRIPK
ncbi:MAG: glycine dehydrogenase (aminomethyl-transferring) [Elusimicrobia bacterium RIFCSPLOWO2_01_FULL_59_12]|nr:MAG: glycine dehydrogenase (aminomethyl-transferring) [Elusimicrobia bacterium RIFCSPLOWO2_01_FULL_59_12]